jgi:putative hemolysin
MWSDVFLIIIFIIVNGFFAAAEIAVVATRRIRLRQLVEEGNKNALVLQKFKENPERFLATTQIGITLAGVIAAAIGGAAAVKIIKPAVQEIPVKAVSASAEAISIGIATLVITYFLLIFGELIPKSIAFANPERIGLKTARIVEVFSKAAFIFVQVLTLSTNMLLKPFGKKTHAGRAITEEEVRMLIREGGEQGVFEPTEEALIHSVFEFKEVMVPSTRMVTISLNMSAEDIKNTITGEQFSRYPVIGRDPSDIRGVLYAKDFLNALARGAVDIRKLIKPPFFIPETLKISNLLREMQRKRVHMALVIDEYGGISGLVTMEDLLEEIVGEIRDEYDIESPVVQLSDGVFLVDASISIRDLEEDHQIEIPESTEYETLGGFLLTSLQKIPRVGDIVEVEGKRLTISEMVGRRISKVKLEKLSGEASEG